MTDAAEIALGARWVAAAMSGSLVSGDDARVFDGVSIDSRTAGRGELFIAIRGERFDGVDFVGGRGGGGGDRRGGAAGRARGLAPVVIEVDDTTAALQALASRIRAESGAAIVAITGSAGKTTTKEVAAEFLGARYRTFRNRGNLNNHIGLPLSLVELRRRPEMAVVEFGMNHPEKSGRSSASPDPMSGCGPMSATRISGSFHRSTRSPTRRRKSWRRPRRTRFSWRMPTMTG